MNKYYIFNTLLTNSATCTSWICLISEYAREMEQNALISCKSVIRKSYQKDIKTANMA